ncbi:MAG: PEP-utilizing enzyme, partial [Patescibacteria group bacterium]|nr:PEP-utilizing enzyme [Patescibacteria group bacterium]
KISLDKFDIFFKKVIKNLKEASSEVKKYKNWKSFEKFIKYYKLGRAIVLYTSDLAEGAKLTRKLTSMKKNIKIIGRWHEDSEVATCNLWDEIKIFYEIIAKEHELQFSDLMFYTPDELKNLYKKEKKVSKDELIRRKKLFLIYLKDGKIYFFSGKKARNIINKEIDKKSDKQNIKSIKGNVAFKGKVKGRVKIINNSREMKKMKKGDIIVSVMTAPRIYPALTKAKGIVTDEGGIVCHAAIVSRELKIPCIVGTKNASKILKYGDMIELDANKGEVKIIN